jgi:hypothetical protein
MRRQRPDQDEDEDGMEIVDEGRELARRAARAWVTGTELIPVTHLSLDLDEPIDGWTPVLLERGVEIAEDDLGRPCVRREVLGALLREGRERLARIEADAAARAAAVVAPVAVGVPSIEGMDAHESMMSAPGYTTVREEFGLPAPHFLDEQLEAGRRADADKRAEAELLKKAQRVLDGQGDK